MGNELLWTKRRDEWTTTSNRGDWEENWGTRDLVIVTVIAVVVMVLVSHYWRAIPMLFVDTVIINATLWAVEYNNSHWITTIITITITNVLREETIGTTITTIIVIITDNPKDRGTVITNKKRIPREQTKKLILSNAESLGKRRRKKGKQQEITEG